MTTIEGKIVKVSGPLIIAKGMMGVKNYEVVKVSDQQLMGEVIELKEDLASIQVYEETSGIGPGSPVYGTGDQLSVELGPGLIGSIYDGIQRPLEDIYKQSGDFISRGINVSPFSKEKKWKFEPILKKGDKVNGGDILGETKETPLINHKIMIPSHVKEGTVKEIKEGEFNVTETIAEIETSDGQALNITMTQKWPIREPRSVNRKIASSEPLITGQRVIDTFFPIAKGGAGCVPGGFGTGKTVVQHQISKWADADVIVFIGCGERGNEMTDVLQEFPELEDPKTGRPLMERTILIANTSNMPVAAREASIYTGITIAEYFRDMGYGVALMADSTSRWAEALREMSGRLEEMPGEEGYPAYLGSRTASFYERAGMVECKGSDERKGSLTVIGAVSPPGGDLSEPVTQNTLRVSKVFWSLDKRLAHARHFPAIDWLNSYSLYFKDLLAYLKENIGSDFSEIREESMRILNKEAELEEIVRLVGYEGLSDNDKLIMNTAKSIREDFLQQNAFDEVDTYTPLSKQYKMLKTIIEFDRKAKNLIEKGQTIEEILNLPEKKQISKLKYEA